MDDEKDFLDELPEVSHYAMGNSSPEKKINADPFNKPAAEVKNLGGTSAVFKRRVTNELKKFQRGVDAGTKRTETTGAMTAYNVFETVVPPYNLDYLARLYELSSPHYSAVNAKTSNIVGLGYKLVENNKTKRRLEDLDNDADKKAAVRKRLMRAKDQLEELLESFNEEDSFTETLVKMWRDYEATGNGYLEVSRKEDGTIGYIGHIPAASLRIRRNRDGFVQINSANDAIFFRNFGDTETPNPVGSDQNPNEIIHVKKYSPTSTFYGVPDIVAASTAVAGNEFSARFNLDYFENKAVPRHLIVSKGVNLNPSVQNALLSFFETSLKGQHHRSLFIPLPADSEKNKVSLEIKPIEAGVQDASFNNYRKSNLYEILMVHRVPITKVGVGEGASLATARDADKTFKEQVCAPEQRIFEKKLNKIIKEFTDAFEIKLNEMTLTDADTQSKIDERDVRNQIKVPNEIRAERGLPGRKGGDKPLDLKPQQRAEATTQRERDANRSASATDSAGEGRNPKGDGRSNGE